MLDPKVRGVLDGASIAHLAPVRIRSTCVTTGSVRSARSERRGHRESAAQGTCAVAPAGEASGSGGLETDQRQVLAAHLLDQFGVRRRPPDVDLHAELALCCLPAEAPDHGGVGVCNLVWVFHQDSQPPAACGNW